MIHGDAVGGNWLAAPLLRFLIAIFLFDKFLRIVRVF